MVEPIRYVSTNSNLTFDFNYQKASLNLLLKVLRRNDKTSAKLKEELIEKAKNIRGFNLLPESDRVTTFFHCQEGKFHVSFLYDSSATTATPWETIIAHNYGELIPLFLEIYDLLKRPIFDSSSATIGNFSVFHQNAIGYHTDNEIPQKHRYLEYKNDREKNIGEETGEDSDLYEMKIDNERNQQIRRSTRQSGKKDTTMNSRMVAIKKSTTTTKKGRKNSLVTKTVQMSASMPALNTSMNSTNGMFTHRYEQDSKIIRIIHYSFIR